MTAPIAVPTGSIRTRMEHYVDRKDACPDHGYVGQGWPASVRLAKANDKEEEVVGCITCYKIWRVVHINPGTERAGA